MRAHQDRVHDEQHEREADVDGGREPAERRELLPAVLDDGGADEAERAERGDADDPPQHALDDLEQRLGEDEERLRLLAGLERRDADDGRDHDHLEDVEADARGERALGGSGGGADGQAEEVLRDEAEEEVPPGADRVWLARLQALAGAAARLDHETEDDADDDRDEGGDREPQDRLAGEAGGVLHATEVRDAGDDRGEDQRDDGRAEQRDVGAADRVEGRRQAGRVLGRGAELAADQTGGDAEDEGGDDLEAERGQQLPDRPAGVWRLLGACGGAH